LRGFDAFRRVLLRANVDSAFTSDSIKMWLNEGLKSSERALTLARHDAGALELRGTVRFFLWSFSNPSDVTPRTSLEEAEADFRAAVDADRHRVTAWNGLSYVLDTENKTRMAGVAARESYRLDPNAPDANKAVWRVFESAVNNGDNAEATHWCAIGSKRFPRNFHFVECRLWLGTLKGQRPSAAELWRLQTELLDQSPKTIRRFERSKTSLLVALGLVRAGLPDSARRVAIRARAEVTPADDPAGALDMFEAYLRASLHDSDAAFKLLESFYAKNPQIPRDETGWWFEDLWTDPRWHTLTSR
jgi:tetratricopeptide (TPR) repeat protein